MKINIKKQLSKLYSINNCFIHESRVYEVINDKSYKSPSRYKYRVILDFDSYDYVTDKELKKKLDKHLKELAKYL
jgi:hypothetical protein